MRPFRATSTLLRGANGLAQASRSQAQAAPRLIASQTFLSRRSFTSSPPLQKKKKSAPSYPTADSPAVVSRTSHAAPSPDHETDPDDPGSKHPKPNPDDPLDFGDVASRFASLATHHMDILKKMQAGDRFSSDAIGALPVHPDKKDPATSFPLRELAEIVPRPGGRTVSLLLHEKDYLKPVMSAVQASPDFNQQPQRDPDNELELILKVEPQNKDAVVRKAKDAAQAWREKLRAVTEKRKKVHTKWNKEKLIVPDLRRRADAELKKIQDKEMKGIDAVEEQTIRKLT